MYTLTLKKINHYFYDRNHHRNYEKSTLILLINGISKEYLIPLSFVYICSHKIIIKYFKLLLVFLPSSILQNILCTFFF